MSERKRERANVCQDLTFGRAALRFFRQQIFWVGIQFQPQRGSEVFQGFLWRPCSFVQLLLGCQGRRASTLRGPTHHSTPAPWNIYRGHPSNNVPIIIVIAIKRFTEAERRGEDTGRGRGTSENQQTTTTTRRRRRRRGFSA